MRAYLFASEDPSIARFSLHAGQLIPAKVPRHLTGDQHHVIILCFLRMSLRERAAIPGKGAPLPGLRTSPKPYA
jgi:hypothetical protein